MVEDGNASGQHETGMAKHHMYRTEQRPKIDLFYL